MLLPTNLWFAPRFITSVDRKGQSEFFFAVNIKKRPLFLTIMEDIQIIWLPPSSLTPYAKNTKIHTVDQIDKIAGQIASFGFDQPIVVDSKHVIIKGHGRREAALRLGLEKVPVIVSTLDEYQAMASRIGDNKVAEALWDYDLLKFEFGTLSTHDIDLKLTGFNLEDIKALSTDWDADPTALDSVTETDKAAGFVIKVKGDEEKEDLVRDVITEALRAANELNSVEIE